MFILLQNYDNGEIYESHYSFVNQVVIKDDRVLTFATMDEARTYVYAKYESERRIDSVVIRDDERYFSYSDGYDAVTGYKWVDLDNPII